ncbi:UDP-N-acetylglucosamine 2-epimerase (hydrolyzing) [Ramlibacter ginsenosidimutans]|uniref:UDP-N-acetylglucosamine 2-epimerase (Hydrolyzing) n=1 Tax=Ramlibacter ginsenosidimutans TaxID=502333 RepID=A0A934TUW1_9BURK|nr:UDP-N-acetylglucosamine 2-epimerase [Ramlibacter ginsenosidimutans]MBK6008037.1 UDP-N-acetylglucosamine 2-epimerase (hydrolyzing) [Ramlibacter ginsenosidimutans]
MSARRILYLTGTRADFGLMQSTLQRIQSTPGLAVQVAVTGTHLSAEHGGTLAEVKASGLPVLAEIPVDVLTRTGASMALAIADVLRGLVPLLERSRPDALLLLGDRGEMLAGALAALHVGVPSVHLHGGERSGTVDEPVRHAISKLAGYHFVATEGARERLLKMGEAAERIFVTGAPGLDGLQAHAAATREDTLASLGLPAGSPFVLALFHPVVQQASEAAQQTRIVMQALRELGLPVLWLDPNADAGSRAILDALADADLPPGSQRVQHLPRARFLAAMRHCAVMAGNSSSGIIEAASFGTPVVNIGARQFMREHGPNVIDVAVDAASILQALRAQAGHGPWPWDNPWGDGRAGERIAQMLARLPLDRAVLEKTNSY